MWRGPKGGGRGPRPEQRFKHLLDRLGGTAGTEDLLLDLLAFLARGPRFLVPVKLYGTSKAHTLLQVNADLVQLALLAPGDRYRCEICNVRLPWAQAGAPCPACHGSLQPWDETEVERNRYGRRSRVGVVLGYTRSTPHDGYFFDHPEEMIAGEVPAPSVGLGNRGVILRHLHAIAIGQALPGLAGKMADYMTIKGEIRHEAVYEFPSQPASLRLWHDRHEEEPILVERRFGIAQYQPGARAHARGHRWRVVGLDQSSPWNPKSPEPDWVYVRCKACDLRYVPQSVTRCPRCGCEEAMGQGKGFPGHEFGGFLAVRDDTPVLEEEDRFAIASLVNCYPQWNGQVRGRWRLPTGWTAQLRAGEEVRWLNEWQPPTPEERKLGKPYLHEQGRGFRGTSSP